MTTTAWTDAGTILVQLLHELMLVQYWYNTGLMGQSG